MSRRWRVALAIGGGIVLVLIGLGVLGALLGPPPTATKQATATTGQPTVSQPTVSHSTVSHSTVVQTTIAPTTTTPPPTTAPPTTPPPTAPPVTTASHRPTTTVRRVTTAFCPLGVGRCPDSRYTPGVVATTSAAVVCAPGYADAHRRSLTTAQKLAVRAHYGLSPSAAVAEWDHLEAVWAGGVTSPANVWPQTSVADRRAKDALEDELFVAVCRQHSLALPAAQDRMRHFWAWLGWHAPVQHQAPATTPPPAAPAPPPPAAPAPAPGAGVYYPNCAAARAAGVAPLHRGEPGYRPGLDRDNDGVACE